MRSGIPLATPLTAWLLACFALPLAIVLLLSLQQSSELFAPLDLTPSTAQFGALLGDAYYLRILLDTVLLGCGVTIACALLGYPIALWLTRLAPRWRAVGVGLVLVPLLTNVAVRSLGIMLLLGPGGVVGAIAHLLALPPPRLLFTWFAVGLALAQVFLPYMVMSLYDTLQAIDTRLDEAASGLGAAPVRRFFAVTLPLTLGGLRAGIAMVFLMSSTAYVSATLLGGKKLWVAGMVVFDEALQLLDYPKAAALAVLMLVLSLSVTFLINLATQRLTPWTRAVPRRNSGLRLPAALMKHLAGPLELIGGASARLLLFLGLGLLIFPMALVIVSSVNDSPQATVAQFLGFTWKWYGLVLDNKRYIDAFILSLQLALGATVIALALSLPAAFALVRRRLRGREFWIAGFMLPLALPGIALAIGMLKLLQWFVAIPAFLGLLAIHVVLIVPFTLAMLRNTVMQLDPTLEEAAAGLGAAPLRRFLVVVLPQLAPGLFVAGVIGFLISFGEVTVTAFLTTAQSQTLPVRIYAEAAFSLENTVNAVSTLIIVATCVLLLAVNRVVRLDRMWQR